ncbi:hypothetical protein FB567DRAFT_546679 [Paraphoma chrysanthemicola]|uniref:Uncharacterized protein n=1 Tax=Paraphoma chrysanthemicola TaxID=798071 RepID=A0A8K0R913_9PLEO|nr:hypothetical protein FB567DRAFT_546679 [Paraphoma chrysanthemicola]
MRLLYLSLYINTLCYPSVRSAADIAAIPHVLPESFSPFGDFEVLSVHQDDEEDVVQIRRRANEEDCESDCMTYTPWTESGTNTCDESIEDLVTEEKRSLLEKRRKNAPPICDKVSYQGLANDLLPTFQLWSPNWPPPGDTEERNKMVYDTGDPTKPLEPEWFQLECREQRWTTVTPGKKGNRCYDTEHVLEWQLLAQFIQEDRHKGAGSRCAFIWKYFTQKKMDLKAYKVKIAKNKGKLDSDGHFEYEDGEFLFDKYENSEQKEPRAIEWISFQWPGNGNAQAKPPSPWEYELVVLNKDVNIKKMNVWAPTELFPPPKVENGEMKQVEANSKTLEWAINNDYWDRNANSMKKWPDNKGTCKTVHMFATLMTIVQYHNDPFVREVMRAQVTRVGNAFAFLEENVLVNEQWVHPVTGSTESFKPRDLRKDWFDFMKTTHKDRLDKLTQALAGKISILESKSNTQTKLKRWDYAGIFRRAPKTPNCGFEKDDKNMKKRIELLVDAYKNLKPVESELKLD